MQKHLVSGPGDFSGVVSGDHYYLANSIDLNDCEFYTVPFFQGIFDFSGYTVFGLNKPLFAYLDAAIIRGLSVRGGTSHLVNRSTYSRFHRVSIETTSEIAFTQADEGSQFYMCTSKQIFCGYTKETVFKNCQAVRYSLTADFLHSIDYGLYFCKTCGYCGQCSHVLCEYLYGKLEMLKYEHDLDNYKLHQQIIALDKLADSTPAYYSDKYEDAAIGSATVLSTGQHIYDFELRIKAMEDKLEYYAMQLEALRENDDYEILHALFCQLGRLHLEASDLSALRNLLLLTANCKSTLLNRSLAHQEVLNGDFLTTEALQDAERMDCLLLTPLQYAALLGKDAIAEQLVSQRIGLKNRASGYSALMLAATTGNAHLVGLLAEYECDILTDDGKTALQMARNEECAYIIRKATAQ